MKTIISRTGLAAAALACALYGTACKDNATQNTSGMKDSDVANTIAASLGGPTNGLTSQAEVSANLATTGKTGLTRKQDGAEIQGTAQDTTVTVSGTNVVNGQTFTYNYTFAAHSTFHLSDGTTSPKYVNLATTSADVALSMGGVYDTPWFTGADSATANWTVGNVLATTPLTLNGSYMRKGMVTGKAQGNSFSYLNTLTLSALQIGRVTKKVDAGTATATVSGVVTDATGKTLGEYSFTGVVTFKGSNTAQLDLTNNTTQAKASFLINLANSTATRI